MEEEPLSTEKLLGIYRGLVEVSGLINSINAIDSLLPTILDIARRVMQAEAASLFLVDAETGELRLTLASFQDKEYVTSNISVPRGKGIAGYVLEHGTALLIPNAYEDERFYREADRQTGFTTRSILCAPLQHDGATLGVIQVLNPCLKSAFSAEDLEGFSAYANLTGTAIEKLRSMDRTRAQERVERDLAIAAEIQRELLSRAIPATLPHFSFAAHNAPAANVGGDFYGVFPRATGEVFFTVGDVSGKGISASLLMAQTLAAMRFVFAQAENPADALARLNATLAESVIRGMFITALVGRLNVNTREVELASAGHCAPVLLRKDGIASRIATQSALPLGILASVNYKQSAFTLEKDDLLVFYTDGLSESRGSPDGQLFDESLLAHAAGPVQSAQCLLDRLVAAEDNHRGLGPRLDDLTILVGGFE